FAVDEQVASCVAIPLRVGRIRVGIMFINYRTSHRFTGDDLENIELFANQAAVAIYNAQLFQREQRRTFMLKALYNASQSTTVSLNLDNVLRQIVEQAWHLVSYQDTQISYASIWRVVDESQARLVATFPSEAFQQTMNKIGDVVDWQVGQNGRIGIMGRAIHSGQTVRVLDVTQDPDYLESQRGTRSEVAVPIKLDNNILGVINVEHGDFNAFDDENIQALESLAAQAAVAMQNVKLFETAVGHAKLLDAAAQVASHAITILDEDLLLKETVNLISDRLEFYHTAVFLLDEKRKFAELRAATSEGGIAMLEQGYWLGVGEDGIVGLVAQRGELHLTSDVDHDPSHLVNAYLPDTRSEMTFPLIAQGEVIGVLDVQSRRVISLSDQEIAALETMANQLATAIQNARLYSNLIKQKATLEALFEAGQSITGSLERDQVLAAIAEQAWKLTGTHGPKALFSCIVMVNNEAMDFVAAYPSQRLQALQAGIGSIDLNGAGPHGIMGEAVLTGMPQLVGDVTKNGNYLEYGANIRSELAVPIKRGDDVIGVINVEHPELNAFDSEDQQSLLALATQASAAIDRAQSYQALKETYQALQHTNRLVRARTAVAWMGMASSIWRHDIANHALTIREQVQLLQMDLQKLGVDSQQKHNSRLEMITRLADKIRDKPITLPLSAEEGIDSVSVNALVEERARQLWQNHPYQETALRFDLQTDDDVTIRVSSEWFRRAFDILIDNAVEAMETCEVKQMTVQTRVVGTDAEVAVIDTGPGLPELIQKKIGIEYIEKLEDATGLGMGLLMAQMIVQAYGGEIKVGATGASGTAMLICMPLEQKER
ncbi:MAG: GAF domain-containing protein, partial [Chloroflexi bacterium]|nr:GAF domain-containing protein [Chloroflexota bacterium]